LVGFGNNCLAPAIPVFRERYPEIEVYLEVGTDVVNLIEQPFDVAIRVGILKDSSLIARKICTQKAIILAAPAFVRKFGLPHSLEDLKHFPSVTQISGQWGRNHQFNFGKKTMSFETPRDYVVNSSSALRNALLTGCGYGIALEFSVAHDVENGHLVRLLPDYESAQQAIYAVYPNRRYLPAKVRLFIDFLGERFSHAIP
jgi:LysR family transcriptional regulator for bpeEF and oprC